MEGCDSESAGELVWAVTGSIAISGVSSSNHATIPFMPCHIPCGPSWTIHITMMTGTSAAPPCHCAREQHYCTRITYSMRVIVVLRLRAL